MIAAILLDADGIVIQGRERYFSSALAVEQGIDEQDVITFIKREYKDCVLGTLDLKDAVAKYLDTWKWTKSVDELLEYWFSLDGQPSEEVLRVVQRLRERGMKVYIASDHTQYRADDIMRRMGMNQYFDGSFFSCDFGHTKTETAFYEHAAQELGISTSEMMFWDDESENVDAAENAGVVARLYGGLDGFQDELKRRGML